jgi:hypothetical protein
MKIIVVSDTHSTCENLVRVMDIEQSADLLIHLGDLEGSEEEVKKIANCKTHIIAGNNDFFTRLDREKEFELLGHKIFITHGNRYQLSQGTKFLKEEARRRGADIVMYGHTHRPEVSFDENLMVLNPGSLTYPRQEGRSPSYIVLEMNEKNCIGYSIRYLSKNCSEVYSKSGSYPNVQISY